MSQVFPPALTLNGRAGAPPAGSLLRSTVKAPRVMAVSLLSMAVFASSCHRKDYDRGLEKGFEKGREMGYESGLVEGRRQALSSVKEGRFFWYATAGFATGFVVMCGFMAFLCRHRLRELARRHANRRLLKRYGNQHDAELTQETMERVMPVLDRHAELMAVLEGKRSALSDELYRRLLGALVPVPGRALDLGVLLSSLSQTRAAFPEPATDVQRTIRALKHQSHDVTGAAGEAREEKIKLQEDRARQIAKLDANLERIRTKLDNFHTFLGNLAMEVSQWALVECDESLSELPTGVSREIERLAEIVREQVKAFDSGETTLEPTNEQARLPG